MKINLNKIIAGILITSSITKEANAINFNYNSPNLEKTFEVAEIPSQNFAELSLTDQGVTDVYSSVRGPVTCFTPCEEVCWSTLNYALDMCMISIFPPACMASACAVFGTCMGICAAMGR